jgi:hypothetical protein
MIQWQLGKEDEQQRGDRSILNPSQETRHAL